MLRFPRHPFIPWLLRIFPRKLRAAPLSKEIVQHAQKQLPHCGVLRSKSGFVYVDVDDRYVHELIKFIRKEGYEEPPYFGRESLVGAHISVIYPDELKKYGISEIDECGETINFAFTGCHVVHPSELMAVDEVYFISLEAPELDLIRTKYGLPKCEYGFHITIGVRAKAGMRPKVPQYS